MQQNAVERWRFTERLSAEPGQTQLAHRRRRDWPRPSPGTCGALAGEISGLMSGFTSGFTCGFTCGATFGAGSGLKTCGAETCGATCGITCGAVCGVTCGTTCGTDGCAAAGAEDCGEPEACAYPPEVAEAEA